MLGNLYISIRIFFSINDTFKIISKCLFLVIGVRFQNGRIASMEFSTSHIKSIEITFRPLKRPRFNASDFLRPRSKCDLALLQLITDA
jgi:hypothetical protein